jgi:hypothetical protein
LEEHTSRTNRNFYVYARGSNEVKSRSFIGNKVEYFTVDEIAPINEKYLKVVEELNKIVRNLSLTSTNKIKPLSTA